MEATVFGILLILVISAIVLAAKINIQSIKISRLQTGLSSALRRERDLENAYKKLLGKCTSEAEKAMRYAEQLRKNQLEYDNQIRQNNLIISERNKQIEELKSQIDYLQDHQQTQSPQPLDIALETGCVTA